MLHIFNIVYVKFTLTQRTQLIQVSSSLTLDEQFTSIYCLWYNGPERSCFIKLSKLVTVTHCNNSTDDGYPITYSERQLRWSAMTEICVGLPKHFPSSVLISFTARVKHGMVFLPIFTVGHYWLLLCNTTYFT